MMTDPISDFLIRIKNALRVNHEDVMIPHSQMKESMTKILHDNGLIESYQVVGETAQSKYIKVDLKYDHLKPVISNVKRVSKPGRRVYVGFQEIPHVQRGFGLSILSTPKGVLSDRQARELLVGGELLCQIW